MATDVVANNAQTTIATAVSTTPAAGTSETWTVASTAGNFPVLVAGTQFRAVVGLYSDSNPEIVIVTSIASATTFVVTRGAEGSPIKTHAVGEIFALTLSAGIIQQFPYSIVPTTSAYLTTAQTVTNALDTLVTIDTIEDDPAGLFSTSTHLWTCPQAGVYLISAQVQLNPGTTTGLLTCGLYKNATSGAATWSGMTDGCFSGNMRVQNNKIARLAVNDTIGVDCFQTSGASQSLISNIRGTRLSVAWLSN